jgi:hypothetical protein
MKTTLIIMLILLGSFLAACEEGDFAQYADSCPAGYTLKYENSKGAAVCVR